MSADLKLEYTLDYWIDEEEKKKYNQNKLQYFNKYLIKYNTEFIKSQNYNCLLYNWSFKKNGNNLKVEGQLQNDNFWETSNIKKIDIMSTKNIINSSKNYLRLTTFTEHNYILPMNCFLPTNNTIQLNPNQDQTNLLTQNLKNVKIDLEKWRFIKKRGLYNIVGFFGKDKIISSPINFCVFEKDVLLISTVNNYLYVLDYTKIKGNKTFLKF